ncbi:tetratricopeptide repeat protein [Maribacter stanieri]|uniref:Tetratricopeptide repeat-containing protein n=1 Tax=Maribacter stanieri TaxID=440514 RepID=A0A1I6JBJ0_9FLAO|nr:CDC27 family protein [Maribacter stanieri]SFR75910.1 Tetratricopeptide repeat-containing protein [Maribacter stanieri]
MKLIKLLIVVILVSSCGTKNKDTVAHKKDYNKYLVSNEIETTSKYFDLWNSKIRPDSMQLTSFGVVGGEYNRYFQQTGDIKFLKKAEKSLKKAVDIANIGKPGFYRSLARNYISQHRFKEALLLADSAAAIGGDFNENQSLFFDIHMELGSYQKAEQHLDSLKNMSDFGYMIRLAKWNDYKGDLDTTINFMEKARTKAETSKSKDLMLWSYTNLADYYGHAGRIQDSYNHYLKALEIDNDNAYAKKGIAWIVFSNDKNAKEAIRILDSVTKTYNAPDYFLLKAEIADYIGNDLVRTRNLDEYFTRVKNEAYGDMYNAYNLGLYVGETKQYDNALILAQQEVENRPTPESYSWLAYSLLKNGDKEKALEVMNTYVYGKTIEPALLYQAAEVYKANGKSERVKELKGELIGAIYELGPGMEKQVHDL